MTTEKILNIVGLLLQLAGAGVAGFAVILTRETATDLATGRWDLHEPLRDALLQQSHSAAVGLALVAAGAVLQLVAVIIAD